MSRAHLLVAETSGDIQHRDAWLLLRLFDPGAEADELWMTGAMVLLLPNPRATLVQASEYKLAKMVRKLSRATGRVAHRLGAPIPVRLQVLILLGLLECGWKLDLGGALQELRRIGRDDLVREFDELGLLECGWKLDLGDDLSALVQRVGRSVAPRPMERVERLTGDLRSADTNHPRFHKQE